MRVLVLGGYGGFGARVSLRLAAAGHDVLVAGRDLGKAQALCMGGARLSPVVVDRNTGVVEALAQFQPTVLVDAAGPFQGSDWHVPKACIVAGVHYFDLADSREFVLGIEALNKAAQAAGVVVVTGASSVPALSGSVVRQLVQGMERVSAIEVAISASNRAAAGASVAAAILHGVGQPLRLWRGGRWQLAHGWQWLERQAFSLDGGPSLGQRWVALCDVPDLALLPKRVLGEPATTFKAGTELAFQNGALWGVSWLVRWGWLTSIRSMARWLLPLQGITQTLGSDRSGMLVRVFGWRDRVRVERRWTLVASDGDGPEIPAMAAPLLVNALAEGHLKAGAGDAGMLLSLAHFAPSFDALSIKHEQRELAQQPSLYQRVMGPAYDALPSSLRAVHNVLRSAGAAGEAVVTRGTHPLARLVAWVMRFPSEGTHALHVLMTERDGVETWRRDFAGRAFESRLRKRGRRLQESFGPLHFAFDLPSDSMGLCMVMRAWWLGPLRLPLALAPRSIAREWGEGGRFHFDVPIALPGIGLLVHYRGWLVPI